MREYVFGLAEFLVLVLVVGRSYILRQLAEEHLNLLNTGDAKAIVCQLLS